MKDAFQVLRALSGETRFKLIRLLLQEELCVCELEEILQMTQPAISQQMRILRDAGIAEFRREGNWIFYRVDPDTFEDLWNKIWSWLSRPAVHDPMEEEWQRFEHILIHPPENCPPRQRRRSLFLQKLKAPKEIRFICTGNSCRSQMAEYILRHLADPAKISVASAGLDPQGVHPVTIEVMEELGIDMSGASSKAIDIYDLNQSDLIITLCGDARESCPVTPPHVERRHWDLTDPSRAEGTPEEIRDAFRVVRDDISRRVRELLQELDAIRGEGS